VTAEETIMATDYAVPTDTPARLLTERRTFPRIAAWPLAWRHAALGVVLLVAAALNLWGLNREGYANTYYAAAVKGMLTSWHNFAWATVSVANNNGAAWLPQAGPATSPFGPGGRGGFGGRRGRPSFGAGPAGFRPPAGGQGTRSGLGVAFGRGVGRRRFGGGGFGSGGTLTFSGDQPTSPAPTLIRYLQARQGTPRYLVATATSSYASLFTLRTNQPAMALGGYQGWDRIVIPSELAHLVAKGTVRFFYLPAGAPGAQGTGPGGPPGQATTVATQLAHANDDLTMWVQTHCAAVPATAWQTATAGRASASGATARDAPREFPGAGGLQLYDCAGTAHK
jgi:hypothetical protein